MPWGGSELAGPFSLLLGAEQADPVAVQVVDRHPVAQARGIIHTAHAVQLSDVNVVFPEHHGVRPVDVVPHGDEAAFHVENLYAMGLPIHDVDSLVFVDGDVMGPDELAGAKEEGDDVIQGSLFCAQCDETYPIDDAIPNLLPPQMRA